MPRATNGGTIKRIRSTAVRRGSSILEGTGMVRWSRLVSAVGFGALLWVVSCLLLWWLYDLSPAVTHGSEPKRTALIRVAEMGCIIVALAVSARLLRRASNEQRSAVKAGWSLSWKAALLLFGYGLLVVVWRQSWTPSRGTSDDAMFLPVLGGVNAAFFSEVGWIIYFVELVPILTVVAGLLYFAEVRLTSSSHSNRPQMT
jgi:hypothetical protein